MYFSYFLKIAREMGYENKKKEVLWDKTKQEVRHEIFTHLASLRWVRQICEFEEIYFFPKNQHDEKLKSLVDEWSKKTSIDDLPITLAPFVFFSFNGKTFSIEVLKNETERFFWHPKGTFMGTEENF